MSVSPSPRPRSPSPNPVTGRAVVYVRPVNNDNQQLTQEEQEEEQRTQNENGNIRRNRDRNATTVVNTVASPSATQPQTQTRIFERTSKPPWKEDLLSCNDDPMSFGMACLCPCISVQKCMHRKYIHDQRAFWTS